MDKETLILRAIMQRYGSLTILSEHYREDSDTVIINLEDDVNGQADYGEIEDYIMKILS